MKLIFSAFYFFIGILIGGCHPLTSESNPMPIESGTALNSPSTGLINTGDKQAVVQAYNNWYSKVSVGLNFSGNVSTCNAGTTTVNFQESVVDRINFYRAMVGLNSAVLFPNQFNNNKAALMMDANHSLNHNPPSTWLCYSSEGAASAGTSNLTLGVSGREAIDLYMDEPGGANSMVGHRRWLLYPPQSKFSTGDTPNSNSLGVFFTAQNSIPSDLKFVAWPSAGFFPIKLLPISNRWSFSSLKLGNIAQATVSMKNLKTGQNIPVSLEPYFVGYGSDTLAWRTDGLNAGTLVQETTFQVTISNIQDAGVIKSYNYNVIAFPVN